MADHDILLDLLQRAQTALQAAYPNYALGWEVPNTDALPVAFDHESKARWRQRLAKYQAASHVGAATDLAAIPVDAADYSGVGILLEICHLPTGTRAVQVFSIASILAIWNDGTKTLAQKRQIVANQIKALYDTCVSRVPVG